MKLHRICVSALAVCALAACSPDRETTSDPITVEERVEYFKQSARAGNGESAYILGSLFHFGMQSDAGDIAPDLTEAAKWYLHGARLGNPKAQVSVGQLYLDGTGVKRNTRLSARWYRKAADQGDANGQNGLGLLYSQGTGVVRDFGEAAQWFQQAVDQGHQGAVNNLSWQLATCPDAAFRDGPLAVRMMEDLLANIQPTSTTVDTLAAAYAEAGNFELAVETQSAAISLLTNEGNDDWVEDFGKRLSFYRDRKPWRE